MKETGVVRRLDELGRIVIPKEIRKNLKINEGDLIEIYVEEKDNVVLKKHTPFKVYEEDAYYLSKTLYEFYKNTILITNLESIINGFGYNYGNYIERELSLDFQKFLLDNNEYYGKEIQIINDRNNENIYFKRLEKNSEIIGCILMIEESNKIDENIQNTIKIVSSYFAKKIDI